MFKNKIFIIITGFYIFWLGILPFALTKAIAPVCRNISLNSPCSVSIKNPKIKTYILPVIKFKADEFKLSFKKDYGSTEIKKLSIKFRLLPLLSGKMHINKFSAEKLDLTTKLKQKFELDKNWYSNFKNTKVICDFIKVDDFKIKLYLKDTEAPVLYDGNDFVLQNKHRYFKLKTDSIIKTGNTTSGIDINLLLPNNSDIARTVFDVEISNLDIFPLGEFFKNFLPKDIQNLKGTINIKADKDGADVLFENVAINMKDKDLSMVFPDKLTLNSKFNLKKDLIVIHNLNLISKNINVNVNGRIKDYFGKITPNVNLGITVNKSKVEDFIDMLPPFNVEDFNSIKLKKYKFYGDVIGNLTVKGRFPEPDINGNVFVDNGILIKPIPNTQKGASIKLKFTGRYINYDISVPAGMSEKVWVKGVQELYNIKYADLTVKSTKNVVLPVAEAVVNPLHEILNFIIGPVPILDVYDGTGNIDINVKGNKKNPHVWGSLNFYKAGVRFNEIPELRLNNADAVLTFNDKYAVFETKTGSVNGKDFKINGSCDLSGKLDFSAVSEGQLTQELYRAIKTSTMLDDFKKIIPDIDSINGLTDINLKIYGVLKEVENLKINKNVFVKGNVKIKNNIVSVSNITADNMNAEINLDGTSSDAVITAKLDNQPLNISLKVKNDIGDVSFQIPKLNPNFIIIDENLKHKEYLPYISANAQYKGNINKIDFKNLKLNAKVLHSNPKSIFEFSGGEINLNNNRAEIKDLNVLQKGTGNKINADLKISDAFSETPLVTGVYKVNLMDLTKLNDILIEKFLPEAIRSVKLNKGVLKFSGKVVDNKITTDFDLGGIEFVYEPFELPVKIMHGKVVIRNNNLRLNKINLLVDDMPILADGEIKDLFAKNVFDIYINSKPKQDFIDKYLNKKIIYPLKIKGDIVYSAVFKGISGNYDLKAEVNMNKDSSIYHYGATIGDIENAIVLNTDLHVFNNKNIQIREFLYDKLIESQNGKKTKFNILKASGKVDLLENDLGFNNFRIKTSMPVDARIFNIIFGKPNIKQGRFTSDLRLNGKLSNPKILGDFHIFETNIPFLDTNMKNIEFLFKDRTVDVASKGEILGNDISIEGVLQNKFGGVYYIDSATVYTKDMDLNRIVSKLKEAEADKTVQPEINNNSNVNIKSIVAKNVKIKADTLELRNIYAENFKTEIELSRDNIFKMKDFEFNIAQGKLSGNYQYNLNNNNIKLNLDADSINANDITLALFDLKNQIYGDLTGKINMSCDGESFDKCMQTLNGSTTFNVKDGRMPKLGSLEYLLKAGNLVKGGLTGLSINSIIDIITPLKTGNFSDIFGSITINNGIADDIEISTKGKDLSLFISGIYNFYTSEAEMEVLGLLSRKISTMFGPIGNVSINTLFNIIPGIDLTKDSTLLENINKIPGIELSGKAFRKFVAEIKGNINGDNYVTNFSWIN